MNEETFGNETTVNLSNPNADKVYTIVWQGTDRPQWIYEYPSDETTLLYVFKEKQPNYIQTNGFIIKPKN